jgi:hypothetical protein
MEKRITSKVNVVGSDILRVVTVQTVFIWVQEKPSISEKHILSIFRVGNNSCFHLLVMIY